jgi:hypothetical protein
MTSIVAPTLEQGDTASRAGKCAMPTDPQPLEIQHPLAPPGATVFGPENAHGLIAGKDRDRARQLMICARVRSGPVLVLAGDRHPVSLGPSVRIGALDLTGSTIPHPQHLASYRAICEECLDAPAAGILRQSWGLVRDQAVHPGIYRQVLLVPVPGRGSAPGLDQQARQLHLPSSERGPAPWLGSRLQAVRTVEDLVAFAGIGWKPNRDWIRALNGGAECQPQELIPAAFAVGTAVTIPDHRVSLDLALAQVEQQQPAPDKRGERRGAILEAIRTATGGTIPWVPWSQPYMAVQASPRDGLRVALLLEHCLQDAQRRITDHDATLRTILLDSELAEHPLAHAAAETILRTGRKANCSMIAQVDDYPVPMWGDWVGFTIRVFNGVQSIIVDQNHPVPLDQAYDPDMITQTKHQLESSTYPKGNAP